MAVFAAVMGILWSCSSESPFIPEPEPTDEINMSFRISASETTSTRSILSEEYGLQIENRIDPDDLIIMMFDDNDSQQRLQRILYMDGECHPDARLTELGNGNYILNVKLDSGEFSADSRFSIVSMANWDSMIEEHPELFVGETTLDDIFRYTYLLNNSGQDDNSSVESWVPKDDSLIPMFGLRHCSLKGYSSAIYNEANPMDMGDVNMLRALVKIEVIDTSRNSGAEIVGIELNTRNTRGYLTPGLGKSDNTRQLTSSRIPDMIGVTNPAGYSNKPIRFKKEGIKYTAYVPEIKLDEVPFLEGRKWIDVTLAYKGITEVRNIYMAPYGSDGIPSIPAGEWPDEWKSLLRNHVYRFTIKTINIDTGLELTVDVQPFSSVELSPDFGLERNEDGYIVVRDAQGNIVKYIRTDGSELTLIPQDWPELGPFIGIFDSFKRVLVGNFPDGRSIVFNYLSDREDDTELLSWEIYESVTSHYKNMLLETFSFKDLNSQGVAANNVAEVIIPAFTHCLLDNQGRLINEMRFDSRSHFQDYRKGVPGVKPPYQRVNYSGNRFGDKLITYYKENGEIYLQIRVTDGVETYIEKDFNNE